MQAPKDLRYLKSHEWAKIAGSQATVGVTEYAVEALNRDIVFVELPTVGASVKQGEPFGVIEAVKAVYDLYSPVSGRVVEINENIATNPGVVGQSPFDEGWMIRVEMQDPKEIENILDAEQYQKLIESESPGH